MAGIIQENNDTFRTTYFFMLVMGIVVLFFNIVFYCYGYLRTYVENDVLTSLLEVLHTRIDAFRTPWHTLSLSYLLLALYSYFSGASLSVDGTVRVLFITVSITKRNGVSLFVAGSLVFLSSPLVLYIPFTSGLVRLVLYATLLLSGFITFLLGGKMLNRIVAVDDDGDYFNDIQASAFPQCEDLLENRYSVNIPMIYRFGKAERHGWINIINPFRATSVMGTPGSGKSFAFINEFIRQHLRKGFSMYVYDYKFPTLTQLTYNNYLKNRNNRDIYPMTPKFRMVNFDDPRFSHRINPIKADTLEQISDAYESAFTIMVSLNRSWADKQGEFFVESPINFLAATIWYLRNVAGGRYCDMPHVIEWCTRNECKTIPIMFSYNELRGYMAPFKSALEQGVFEQLEGQVASVQIPLSRLRSNDMYWVLSGNDFDKGLNINDRKSPVILCVGNNPDRQAIYSSSLSLINGRLIKNVNKKGRQPLSIIIDELPTIFFRGLDNLISTARSNKVSTCIGYQDNTQLVSNYGETEAKKIIRTVGNTVSGQVSRDAAHELAEMFGMNKQHNRSLSSTSEGSVTVGINEQMNFMIPESRIAKLSQGQFVGLTADEVTQPNPYPVFYAKTNLDIKAIDEEEKSFVPIPQVYAFNSREMFDDCIAVLSSDRFRKTADEATLSIADEFIPKFRDTDFAGETDKPEAETVLMELKRRLKDTPGDCAKILANNLEKLQRKTIDRRIAENTARIDKDIDDLIELEVNKIKTLEKYESIKIMMERLLKDQEAHQMD